MLCMGCECEINIYYIILILLLGSYNMVNASSNHLQEAKYNYDLHNTREIDK